MASGPKDKFDAAVKVIRGLPKNGAFQPSHDLMLKFYSYYKQATEGPCRSPKPAFWDMVNKKKWEAWSNLGDMQREEAMVLYVDELKKIVETMPQTEAVTEFLHKLDNFYEMVEDSENHNTLKAIDKPRLNGSVCTNGSADTGDEDEDMTSAYNLAQLLKQDMQSFQEQLGLVTALTNSTNGHSQNFSYSENSGTNGYVRSDFDDRDEYDSELVEMKQTTKSSDEWKRDLESRLSDSQSDSFADSDTDTDVYCDTSNDPVELATSASVHTVTGCLPALKKESVTSTPASKFVHFDSETSSRSNQLSDSLVVNASITETDVLDVSLSEHQDEVFPMRMMSDENSRGDKFMSVCRGGEGHERERRRRGGGQGSQDSSSAGNRDAQGGSGGAGGGNQGGGGHRDMFPGPGGGGGRRGDATGGALGPGDLDEQIVVTLLRLQQDMSSVLTRLNRLEELVKEGRKETAKANSTTKGWWPFPDLSVGSAFVIFMWPLVVHCIISYISRRQRKFNR